METLITVILMGMAVLGILAGLVAVVLVVDHNSRVTHAGNTNQSYIEQLKQPVDSVEAGVADMEYEPCATVANYNTDFKFIGGLPDGKAPGVSEYTVEVTDVKYTTKPIPPAVYPTVVPWSSSCTPATDGGLQLLTVRVRVQRGTQIITETVPLIKRDARCKAIYSPDYVNTDQGPC